MVVNQKNRLLFILIRGVQAIYVFNLLLKEKTRLPPCWLIFYDVSKKAHNYKLSKRIIETRLKINAH